MENRPPIPLPMKRLIRQRCGFGCVICGLPIYEYEHMSGFKGKHIERDITLLCPTHHAEKTKGLMPVAKVRETNAAPFNRQGNRNWTTPFGLHYSTGMPMIVLGHCAFSANCNWSKCCPIAIDGEELISFTEGIAGELFLNAKLFDADGRLSLRIVENRIETNTEAWDVEFVGTLLKLRTGKGKIEIEIKFFPPNQIEIRKGYFQRNGVVFIVRDGDFILLNKYTIFKGLHWSGPCAFSIGTPEIPNSMEKLTVNRFKSAVEQREAVREFLKQKF